MTIDQLNTLASLTANDKIPVWDNEATGEPAKKITAQSLATALIALAGAVLKAGDTMTGNLIVEKAGAKIEAKNSMTGVQAQLLSSDSGPHGVYSEGYYNGSAYVSDSKWLIYRDTDGDVRVNNNPAYVILTSSDTNAESLYKKLSKLVLNSAACVRVFDAAMNALSGKTISGGFGTVVKTGIEANNTLVVNFNICKPDGGYLHCFTTKISQTAITPPDTVYRYTGTVVT